MTASASLGEADRGVVARLRGDAAVKTITGADAGGAARVFRASPGELLQNPPVASAYPRVTVSRVASDPESNHRGSVRLRVEYWSWDDLDALDALEARVTNLLDAQRWTQDSAKLQAVSMGSMDRGGRTPRSRIQTFEVHVT